MRKPYKTQKYNAGDPQQSCREPKEYKAPDLLKCLFNLSA